MAEKQMGNSSVWQGFVKIAEESGLITTDLNPKKEDFVGNPSKSPTGPFRDNGGSKEKAEAEFYGVTKETGKELIEQAHPETIQIADAMGAGGIVENQIEQQQKNMEIATKMPSGALFGVHAQLVKDLAKKATELEEKGKTKEAMRVDLAIKRIAELPFSNRQAIVKEALGPALILVGLGLLGSGGVAANMGFFSSVRQSLSKDLQQLIASLQEASQKPKWYELTRTDVASPSAKKAAVLLRPFVSVFRNIDLSTKESAVTLSKQINRFRPVLTQVGALVDNMEAELGESRWYEMGQGRPTVAKAKYEDVVKNVQLIEKKLQNLSDIGGKALTQQKIPTASKVTSLQNVLVEKGLMKEVSNTMDAATIAAAAVLEKQIDNDLDALGIKRKSSFAGRIVSNGKLVGEPSTIQRILSLIAAAKAKVKVK